MIKNIITPEDNKYLISAHDLFYGSTIDFGNKKSIPCYGSHMMAMADLLAKDGQKELPVTFKIKEEKETVTVTGVIDSTYIFEETGKVKKLPLNFLKGAKSYVSYNPKQNEFVPSNTMFGITITSEDYDSVSDLDLMSIKPVVSISYSKQLNRQKIKEQYRYALKANEIYFNVTEPEEKDRWERPQDIADAHQAIKEAQQWADKNVDLSELEKKNIQVKNSMTGKVEVQVVEKESTSFYSSERFSNLNKKNVDTEQDQDTKQDAKDLSLGNFFGHIQLQKPDTILADIFMNYVFENSSIFLFGEKKNNFRFLDNVMLYRDDKDNFEIKEFNVDAEGQPASWHNVNEVITPQQVLGPGKLMTNPYYSSPLVRACAYATAEIILQSCASMCKKYCEERAHSNLTDLMKCEKGETVALTKTGQFFKISADKKQETEAKTEQDDFNNDGFDFSKHGLLNPEDSNMIFDSFVGEYVTKEEFVKNANFNSFKKR